MLISRAHIKDFLRALIVENKYSPYVVHTIHKCGDELRDNSSLTNRELDIDIRCKDFVPLLKSMGWRMDEISMDHYRMMDAYSESKLIKSFFC